MIVALEGTSLRTIAQWDRLPDAGELSLAALGLGNKKAPVGVAGARVGSMRSGHLAVRAPDGGGYYA